MSDLSSTTFKALLSLVLAACLIGLAPILVKLVDLGGIAIAFWRSLLGLTAVFLLSFITNKKPKNKDKPLNHMFMFFMMIAAGVFFALDLSLWHLSIQLGSVAKATLFVNTAPIWVSLWVAIVWREKVNKQLWLGLVVALVGIFFLINPNFSAEGSLYSDFLALLAGVFYAGYILTLKYLRSSAGSLTILCYTTISATVTSLIFMLIFENNYVPDMPVDWFYLILLAFLVHALGQGLIIYGVAHISAAYSSLILLFQPVVAALLAWWWLGEELTFFQWLAVLTVVFGVYLAKGKLIVNKS